MSDVRRELRNVVQISTLTRRETFRLPCQSKSEGLVVHQEMESPALHKVVKVLDGKVRCKELTIKSTVASLCWLEPLGKVGNRALDLSNTLLQDCAHSDLRGISSNGGGSIWLWMHQEGCICKGLFDVDESGLSSGRPV